MPLSLVPVRALRNMSARLARLYDNLVLKKPGVTLLIAALVTAFFAIHIPDFKLDASADSLILENDQALRYYRSVRARYGSDDNLIGETTFQNCNGLNRWSACWMCH